MNRLWKSLVVVCLFLLGTGFLPTSHTDQGNNLADVVAMHNDCSKEIPTEGVSGMMSLPINSEGRTKGLRVGRWGGEHISMEVTEQGVAVEYDCARGTIEQRVTLDRQGRFSVSGRQFPEHGGPVRQNEEPNGYPVQFAGQVNGKKMTLSVIERGAKTPIGNFTLVFGAEPRLRKCR